MNSLKKSMTEVIKSKLINQFSPFHLELINESFKHSVPKNSETHFKVIIASNKFENMTPVEKHQMVYKVLSDEFTNGLHALSLVVKTEKEWNSGCYKGTVDIPCRGGMKNKKLSDENK